VSWEAIAAVFKQNAEKVARLLMQVIPLVTTPGGEAR